MTDLRIPRDREDDYAPEPIKSRQEHIRSHTGSALDHTSSYTLDPASLAGSVESFFGVAQVPMGVAGPLLVNGEHARVSSSSPWPPPRAPSSRRTTAA